MSQCTSRSGGNIGAGASRPDLWSHCAFEGQSGLEARVEAFRQHFLAEETEPVPFYLEPFTLDLARDHAALIEVIRDRIPDGPVLVVLDTLNRSLTPESRVQRRGH